MIYQFAMICWPINLFKSSSYGKVRGQNKNVAQGSVNSIVLILVVDILGGSMSSFLHGGCSTDRNMESIALLGWFSE